MKLQFRISNPLKNKRNSGITIADVAREADVSAMTVSRALREPSRVSEKSLERISELEIIKVLETEKSRMPLVGKNMQAS